MCEKKNRRKIERRDIENKSRKIERSDRKKRRESEIKGGIERWQSEKKKRKIEGMEQKGGS